METCDTGRRKMWEQIGNWLYQNAMAIFISAVASLLISKRYYDKANRESVLMTIIFPIVKLLNQTYRLYLKHEMC